jgi:molybdopterin-guanine dinucleotide biosynthesis protein A
MHENNILGVILAGGKSKRFGQEKSQVKLGDKTLLEHSLSKLKSKFDKILIVTNSNTIKDYKTIKDCIEGQLGPLVGVLSAMKWIKKNKFSYNWVATFPCDTPFFNISIIEEFYKASKLNDNLLYFVKSKEKRHNIFGLWSLKLIEILEKDIIENNYRKVEKWANKIGVKTINVSYDDIDPFFNINTKEDLIEAEKILKNHKHD